MQPRFDPYFVRRFTVVGAVLLLEASALIARDPLAPNLAIEVCRREAATCADPPIKRIAEIVGRHVSGSKEYEGLLASLRDRCAALPTNPTKSDVEQISALQNRVLDLATRIKVEGVGAKDALTRWNLTNTRDCEITTPRSACDQAYNGALRDLTNSQTRKNVSSLELAMESAGRSAALMNEIRNSRCGG